MDKVEKHQKAIKRFLLDYAKIPSSSPNIRYEVIADDQSGRYCLLRYGWKDQQWTHHCLFHLDIADGKVLVHQNWTDLRLDEELAALGVAKGDVVPWFEEVEMAA